MIEEYRTLETIAKKESTTIRESIARKAEYLRQSIYAAGREAFEGAGYFSEGFQLLLKPVSTGLKTASGAKETAFTIAGALTSIPIFATAFAEASQPGNLTAKAFAAATFISATYDIVKNLRNEIKKRTEDKKTAEYISENIYALQGVDREVNANILDAAQIAVKSSRDMLRITEEDLTRRVDNQL